MTSSSAGQSPDKPLTPREISEAWLEMQGPDYASEFAAKVKIPDMSGLVPPDYFQTLMPALTEMAKNMSAMVAVTFPREQLESIQKTFAQTSGLILRDSVYESYAEMMRGLTPALQSFAQATVVPDIQASMSAMASSLATAIDTSRIQDLLASASALRNELADQDIDELTDEFFWSHPDLAESIDEIPALRVLSKAERNLVIWYVRICVTMTFTCILLNINMEHPQLDAFIGALGITGGLESGKKAGALTGRVLDKLPQENPNS
jgi:hypothetical protein